MPPLPPVTTGVVVLFDTGTEHADPEGVRVHVSEPLAWVIVSVSMQEEHVWPIREEYKPEAGFLDCAAELASIALGTHPHRRGWPRGQTYQIVEAQAGRFTT